MRRKQVKHYILTIKVMGRNRLRKMILTPLWGSFSISQTFIYLDWPEKHILMATMSPVTHNMSFFGYKKRQHGPDLDKRNKWRNGFSFSLSFIEERK